MMPQFASYARQRGLTGMGWLMVLIVLAAAITLTLRLAPHYIDFYTVKSVIQGLPAQEVRTMSRSSLLEALKKRFKINNLRDFDIRDIIDLQRSRDNTVLEVRYERREHLFFNVDVVISFHERFEY